jgi:hypothetical protein
VARELGAGGSGDGPWSWNLIASVGPQTPLVPFRQDVVHTECTSFGEDETTLLLTIVFTKFIPRIDLLLIFCFNLDFPECVIEVRERMMALYLSVREVDTACE